MGHAEASRSSTIEIGMHSMRLTGIKWLPLIVEKLEGDSEEKIHVRELMKRFFNL